MRLGYKAVTHEGKVVRGIIEAKDINEAASYLRTRDLLPIRVWPKNDQGVQLILSVFNRFTASDLVFITRQLSSMLNSGLTLMQSLNILKDQVTSPMVKDLVSSISADVEGGKSFSSAISKYPDIFSPIYISLIKAAETSGLLDKVLTRLADNLEKAQKLNSSIKTALMYPAIVIVGMTAVVFVMMIFVIPQLAVLYESLNLEMPLPTRIVMTTSRFFVLFWPLVIGIGILGFFAFRRWKKTESGQLIFDSLILKIPILGKLTREMVLTEFSRTFALLVGAGTLVVEALNQTAGVAGNVVYKDAITGIAKRVEKGMSVGDSFMYSSLFPPILVQMARIGEETGKLDESLLKVSEYYEREVDQTVKNLMTAIEPLIMVILGIGVAFLIISIITPIYNLTSSIK